MPVKSIVALLVVSTALLALAACGPLPPGRVPFSPTAQQGGGDAYFNHYRNVGQ